MPAPRVPAPHALAPGLPPACGTSGTASCLESRSPAHFPESSRPRRPFRCHTPEGPWLEGTWRQRPWPENLWPQCLWPENLWLGDGLPGPVRAARLLQAAPIASEQTPHGRIRPARRTPSPDTRQANRRHATRQAGRCPTFHAPLFHAPLFHAPLPRHSPSSFPFPAVRYRLSRRPAGPVPRAGFQRSACCVAVSCAHGGRYPSDFTRRHRRDVSRPDILRPEVSRPDVSRRDVLPNDRTRHAPGPSRTCARPIGDHRDMKPPRARTVPGPIPGRPPAAPASPFIVVAGPSSQDPPAGDTPSTLNLMTITKQLI